MKNHIIIVDVTDSHEIETQSNIIIIDIADYTQQAEILTTTVTNQTFYEVSLPDVILFE